MYVKKYITPPLLKKNTVFLHSSCKKLSWIFMNTLENNINVVDSAFLIANSQIHKKLMSLHSYNLEVL